MNPPPPVTSTCIDQAGCGSAVSERCAGPSGKALSAPGCNCSVSQRSAPTACKCAALEALMPHVSRSSRIIVTLPGFPAARFENVFEGSVSALAGAGAAVSTEKTSMARSFP